MQPVSASNILSKNCGDIPRPLTKEEIKLIASNNSDIINIGRGLIANPEQVNKVASSKENESRKYIKYTI